MIYHQRYEKLPPSILMGPKSVQGKHNKQSKQWADKISCLMVRMNKIGTLAMTRSMCSDKVCVNQQHTNTEIS